MLLNRVDKENAKANLVKLIISDIINNDYDKIIEKYPKINEYCSIHKDSRGKVTYDNMENLKYCISYYISTIYNE